MIFLPRKIEKIAIPPIKCQGIKSKLIPFISSSISWEGEGKWIEPFLGSGVVAFNIRPERALLADTNKHIIKFYNAIKSGKINKQAIGEVLQDMGSKLEKKGADYYYHVRERFNKKGDSFDFLFLNRSCFNGLMRFNSKGGFNVPFGQKPNRFTKAYITKIKNQVDNVSKIICNSDWEFKEADWKATLTEATAEDFVYLDPPYIGRHTDYYNSWDDENAIDLSRAAAILPCEYALSMWLENKYRKNEHIENYWQNTELKTTQHFYHIGSSESLRNSMTEALVLRRNNFKAVAV